MIPELSRNEEIYLVLVVYVFKTVCLVLRSAVIRNALTQQHLSRQQEVSTTNTKEQQCAMFEFSMI